MKSLVRFLIFLTVFTFFRAIAHCDTVSVAGVTSSQQDGSRAKGVQVNLVPSSAGGKILAKAPEKVFMKLTNYSPQPK